MDDKIDEAQPLLHGLSFERPMNTITGTECGQSAGCEHGTEAAGMAVATGNSSCGLCTPDTGSEKGVAWGVSYVLDADFGTMPDRATCGYDSGLWALGFHQPPIGDCEHSMPGATHLALVHSDSHGGYTSSDDSVSERNLDKFTSAFGAIQTEPSGNDGLNGTGAGHITSSCIAYDVLCVGGVSSTGSDSSADTIANFSSQGPSPAGRKKPDLVALAAGAGSTNMTVLEQRYISQNRLERGDTGTSFASPQVAGAAALLYGAGLTDPLVVKAILLDSTTLGRATPGSAMGTQTTWQPDWGWGELNLDSAYTERNNFAADSVGAGEVQFYRSNVAAGDRATLVWNRRVIGAPDQTAVPQPLTLSNLDLTEYNGAQDQVASSASSIDNVEQVRGVASGTVVYKVKDQSSTVDGLPAEPFALAAKNPLTHLTSPKPTVTLTTGPSSATADSDITVTETVSNPSGDISGSGATATLSLPDGLTVTSGGSTTWSPDGGTLAPGASATHQWTVRGSADGVRQLTASGQDSAYGETFTASDHATVRIDSTPPAVSISCPASGGTDPNLRIGWSATDASAIAGYDVEVAINGGPYTSLLAGTRQTSSTFSGHPGSAYQFRVRARDALGNLSEFTPCGPIAIGFVAVPPTPTPISPPIKPLPAAPHLKLGKVRVKRGRLYLEGTLARTATGRLTFTYSAHGHRPVRTKTRVKRGHYRTSLRLPRGRPKGLLRVQYLGDRSFAPQRLSRRIRQPANSRR
jgi:hypothetical protein